MSRKSSLDADLQRKYISAIRKIFSDYFVAPRDGFIPDIGSALLLKNSSVILTGAPGTGKSTLLRLLAYELTGKPDSLAVATCTEDIRAEDFIYDMDIRQKQESAGLTRYEFTPLSRPLLTRTFAFVNEVNRLNPRARNALLSVLAEREISVKGVPLKRTDGVILMDMNPSYAHGNLEWAFVDRIRAHLALPALELGDQLRLFKTKYGAGKHVEDLVAYAMKEPAIMTEKELFKVWEDVDKVELDDAYGSNILLFTNVFASCKFPLSDVHSNFKLPCDSCRYNETCVTKMMEHPVLTRSIDHVVKMLKAQAYFDGRAAVDLQKDMLPTLRRTMLHRVGVRPEFASKYPTIEDWYTEEVEQRIIVLQENWKEAKRIYDQIADALKAGKDADATIILNRFKSEAKDVVSVKLTEILQPNVEEASEGRFKHIYARALAMEKTGYTADQIKQLRDEPLVERLARELERVTQRLDGYLSGLSQINEDEYKVLVGALMAVDPGAGRLMPSTMWREETHVFPDESEVNVRREFGKYIVRFSCKSSQTAKAFHDWRRKV